MSTAACARCARTILVGLSPLNLHFSTDEGQPREDKCESQVDLPDPCLHGSGRNAHEVEGHYLIEWPDVRAQDYVGE